MGSHKPKNMTAMEVDLTVSLDDMISADRKGNNANKKKKQQQAKKTMKKQQKVKRGGKPGARGAQLKSGPRRTIGKKSKSNPEVKGKWGHDMFGSKIPVRQSRRTTNGRKSQVIRSAPAAAVVVPVVSLTTGTKIQIDNLQLDVNQDDLEEIFSTCGKIKKAVVYYDETGTSIGNAMVVFSKSKDAQAAVKKFNGTKVDGKPMRITLIETKTVDDLTRPTRRLVKQQKQQQQRNGAASARQSNSRAALQGRGRKKPFGNPLLR